MSAICEKNVKDSIAHLAEQVFDIVVSAQKMCSRN